MARTPTCPGYSATGIGKRSAAFEGFAVALDNILPDAKVLSAIRSDIETLEAQRRAAKRSVLWRAPLAVLVIALGVYVAAGLLNNIANQYEQWVSTPHLGIYVLGVLAAIISYFWVTAPMRRVHSTYRARLFPSIFRFVEDFRYTEGKEPSSFDRLPREMIGAFDRETFDDVITGRYRGFPFELFEAKLATGSGAAQDVAFRGIGLVFEAVQPFAGILIAGKTVDVDGGFFKRVFGSADLQKLEAGQAALDKVYDFRTDNPAAAKPLVVGRLAAALKWLGESWPSGHPLVALKGSDAFVLLPTERDYFELPASDAPLEFDKHIKPMIGDLVSLLETAALIRRVGGDAADTKAPASN